MKRLFSFILAWLIIAGYYYDVTLAYVIGWIAHLLIISIACMMLSYGGKESVIKNNLDSKDKLKPIWRYSDRLLSWLFCNVPAIVVLITVGSYNTLGIVLLSYLAVEAWGHHLRKLYIKEGLI